MDAEVASTNGHAAVRIVEGSEISVPQACQPKPRKLSDAFIKARADLELFQTMLFLAMRLPTDTNWTLDTDTMMISQVGPTDTDD